jgi:hypothetical protein
MGDRETRSHGSMLTAVDSELAGARRLGQTVLQAGSAGVVVMAC